jgi:hypothetical protein
MSTQQAGIGRGMCAVRFSLIVLALSCALVAVGLEVRAALMRRASTAVTTAVAAPPPPPETPLRSDTGAQESPPSVMLGASERPFEPITTTMETPRRAPRPNAAAPATKSPRRGRPRATRARTAGEVGKALAVLGKAQLERTF